MMAWFHAQMSLIRDLSVASLIIASVYIFSAFGYAERADNFLLEKRFELLRSSAETNSVVVEIDTKSLQAKPDWPWSRAVYGELVEILSKDNAQAIAFDIDFSAAGDEFGDGAFSKALENSSSTVFLAAHRQQLSSDMPDIVAEILPHPTIGEYAHLSAVIYPIDYDGVIRRAYNNIEFSFADVPAVGTAMAKRSASTDPFYLDFAIDLDRIDRISLIDVLEGNFDPAFFQGKAVFVGATALELGDEYVMPSYGMRSGVFLNAFSYETLRGGRELAKISDWRIFTSIALLCFLLCSQAFRKKPRSFALYNALIFGAFITAPLWAQAYLRTIIPSAALHLGQILCFMYVTVLELEKRALHVFKARAEAKDSHVLLQTLFLDNNEGFIVVNRLGEIEICNARAAELLNLGEAPLTGQQIHQIVPNIADRFALEDQRIGVLNNFVIAHDAGDRKNAIEVTITRSEVALTQSRFEKRKSARSYIVLAFHDITAQKRAEIIERKAKKNYAALSQAKSQLISNMSHELRTPLNAIIGFSDILKSADDSTSTARDRLEYANMINQSGRNLLSVLNDMLVATTLRSDELKLEISNQTVSELIDGALGAVKKSPVWARQQIRIDESVKSAGIQADPNAMTNVLRHLISNAAKFSGPDGKIEIWADHDGETVSLHVKDDGVGCSKTLLPKLREMFFQGDGAHARSFEGTGLGLFICDSIIALHKGSLTFNSVEGEGFEAIVSIEATARMQAAQNAA